MRRPSVVAGAVLLLVGALLGGLAAPAATAAPDPLAGRVIVVDPGHQLGNSNPRFARQMAQTFFNGTIVKGCNTSGTATNAGYPEATFNWQVAKRLTRMLEQRGARVILTRTTNSYDDWGPCVWTRAQIANRADADAMVSIHGDGSAARNRGFFAIAPTLVRGWTEDVVRVDRRLARAMIAGLRESGLTPANYVSGQLLLSSSTTSLNVSNVPTTTIELGNMRNRIDARLMSSAAGQQAYAEGLLAGLERFFAEQ